MEDPERVLSVESVLDAIQNPLEIGPVLDDATKYIGEDATAVVDVIKRQNKNGYKTSAKGSLALLRKKDSDIKKSVGDMKTISWTQEQLQFLSELDLPFDPARPMTEDQMLELQDVAAYKIEIDPNVPDYIGTPTKRGFVAESVVDVLVDVLG